MFFFVKAIKLHAISSNFPHPLYLSVLLSVTQTLRRIAMASQTRARARSSTTFLRCAVVHEGREVGLVGTQGPLGRQPDLEDVHHPAECLGGQVECMKDWSSVIQSSRPSFFHTTYARIAAQSWAGIRCHFLSLSKLGRLFQEPIGDKILGYG